MKESGLALSRNRHISDKLNVILSEVFSENHKNAPISINCSYMYIKKPIGAKVRVVTIKYLNKLCYSFGPNSAGIV